MGIEGYKATPDESERIDDVAKAQEMAEAGNYQRSQAAKAREEMQPRVGSGVTSTPGAEMAEGLKRKSNFWDKKAEDYENEAGMEYDIKKKVASLSNEEVKTLLSEAHSDNKGMYDHLLKVRGLKNEATDPEEVARLQKAEDKTEQKLNALGVRVSTLSEVIRDRE